MNTIVQHKGFKVIFQLMCDDVTKCVFLKYTYQHNGFVSAHFYSQSFQENFLIPATVKTKCTSMPQDVEMVRKKNKCTIMSFAKLARKLRDSVYLQINKSGFIGAILVFEVLVWLVRAVLLPSYAFVLLGIWVNAHSVITMLFLNYSLLSSHERRTFPWEKWLF